MLTAMSAFLGQAWNLAGGFGGLTSFGHTVFFGLGAYAAAILATRYGISAWFALPLAFVLGAGIGAVIGFASFRAGLRGSHFALVTLAFAEAFRILATASEFTRGGQCINVPLNLGLARFQCQIASNSDLHFASNVDPSFGIVWSLSPSCIGGARALRAAPCALRGAEGAGGPCASRG